MRHLFRVLAVCASLWLGGCFSYVSYVAPSHAGCGSYQNVSDRFACAEGRNDALASQMQRTIELQKMEEHNTREFARSGVRYDPFNDAYHSTTNCKKAGAYAGACWKGLEEGKADALGVWQDTLERHRDNVREQEFLRGGGVTRYGYR